MEYLVGYTGFVGSNLMSKHRFDGVFNSKNIQDAFGANPDLLVYAGIRAEKYLANSRSEEDFEHISQGIDNIQKINPKKIILISTVDVYPVPVNVDERTDIDINTCQPYGKNRLFLERWVENNCQDYLIIRLPGLFGLNLKKNFIYDFINRIPRTLSSKTIERLSMRKKDIEEFYIKHGDGFFRLREDVNVKDSRIERVFYELNFNALHFTDSRSVYQFFNLSYLWDLLSHVLNMGIKKFNVVTEPVRIDELYRFLCGENFINEMNAQAIVYDVRSVYSEMLGGYNGYIANKDRVLKDICDFIKTFTIER